MKLCGNAGRVASAAVMAAALFALTVNAATYYVDPTGGDVSSDDYDGTKETWEGGLVGPKKTLAAVMELASSGDTIIALPGYYNEGVSNPEAKDSTTTLMRRVIVKAGVTLKSKEGPENTFIVGEESPNPEGRGCGVNAVACVQCVNSTARLEGFTVTGGRTLYNEDSKKDAPYDGGGVYAGTVVDCIISNNASGHFGGGARNCALYRCKFYDNHARDGGGDSMFGTGSCRGCYFHDTDVRNTVLYNCTMGSARVSNSTLYNCIANSTTLPGASNIYYRTLCVASLAADVFRDGSAKIASGAIKVDRYGVVTNGIDLVCDKGNNDYLSWSSSVEFTDIAGMPRKMNGTVDIGAYENNPTGDVSRVLSPEGAVTVTNVNTEVVCLEDLVSIGPAGELYGVLNISEVTTPTLWSFFAEV